MGAFEEAAKRSAERSGLVPAEQSKSQSIVDTTNEFLLGSRHYGSTQLVTPGIHPRFTTRQSALRFCAWLEAMSEVLPDEDTPSNLEEIRNAIRNI